MKFTNSKSDETQIIEACRKGKPWAQKMLYDLYAPKMMSVCYRYIPDYDTIHDILQDGFVKVFTNIDSYREEGAFPGWMRRIFVTTALEYLRKNNVLKSSENIDNYSSNIENSGSSVIEELSAEDILNCISELSVGYRTVFNLYAIEGYSHSEIAELIGISEVTSRSQYQRARKILQQKVHSLFDFEYERRLQKY